MSKDITTTGRLIQQNFNRLYDSRYKSVKSDNRKLFLDLCKEASLYMAGMEESRAGFIISGSVERYSQHGRKMATSLFVYLRLKKELAIVISRINELLPDNEKITI